MQNEILGKILPLLKQIPQTEYEVVYVLSEIRKLLERDGREESFERLKFYCDWALHARLSGRMAQEIILKIDAALGSRASGDKLETVLYGLIAFADFRRELKRLFRAYRIEHFALWTEDICWPQVAHLYGRVIRDCELTIGSKRRRKLATSASVNSPEILREVVLRTCLRDPTEGVIEANWTLRFLDEKRQDKSFNVYFDENGPVTVIYWADPEG